MTVNCMVRLSRAHKPSPHAVSTIAGEAPPTVRARRATTSVNITAITHESGIQRSVQRVRLMPQPANHPIMILRYPLLFAKRCALVSGSATYFSNSSSRNIPGLFVQPFETLTKSSRYTRQPKKASMRRRAAWPIFLSRTPF